MMNRSDLRLLWCLLRKRLQYTMLCLCIGMLWAQSVVCGMQDV